MENVPSTTSKIDEAAIKIINFLRDISKNRIIFLLVLASILFFIHLGLSIRCSNFNWLGAYGALLTIFSLYLTIIHTSLPLLQDSSEYPAVQYSSDNADLWFYTPPNCTSSIQVNASQAKIINTKYLSNTIWKYKVTALGYILASIGTLIWAYSGFLNN